MISLVSTLASSLLQVTTGYAALMPPEPLPLGGYTERKGALSQPGGDELGVRILGFRQGATTVVVASCDMLTIPDALRAAVTEQLPPGTTLFLHATHTHCAPDSQMLNDRMTIAIPGIATFKRRWLKWYADEISAAIRASLRGWKPVTRLEIGQFRLTKNRGRRKFAAPDTMATMLQVNGQPTWFNYAAHPVNYDAAELRTRTDWPGVVANRFDCVVTQGALGDVSPAFGEGSPAGKNELFTSTVGRKLALTEFTQLHPELTVFDEPYPLPTPVPHPGFAKANGVTPELAQLVVTRFAPPSGRVTGIRLGKSVWVGLAAEPSADLGRSMAIAGRNLGYDFVVPIGHVNGWIGYVLTPEDYDRGGYEAQLQLHGRNSGSVLVNQAAKAMKVLSGKEKGQPGKEKPAAPLERLMKRK